MFERATDPRKYDTDSGFYKYVGVDPNEMVPMQCRYRHTMRLESWSETRCVEKCTRCGKLNVYRPGGE